MMKPQINSFSMRQPKERIVVKKEKRGYQLTKLDKFLITFVILDLTLIVAVGAYVLL